MDIVHTIRSWFRPPDELMVRNREFFKEFDQTRPLTEYSFVVFDTELTGLDRKKDEIISIGAVKIKNLQIDLGETFHQYIQPKKLDHTEATLVHRITPEQLKEKKGWGHSSWEQAVDVAEKAGARRLALFHHDPEHSDTLLFNMEKECRKRFEGSFLAMEGKSVEL